MENKNVFCKAQNLFYAYDTQAGALTVLNKVSFQIQPGQHTFLKGTSGSGKSTLLHLVGLLDKPKSGHLWLQGEDTATFDDYTRTKKRRSFIGLIYQFHHLLPELSAKENVAFPLLIAGEKQHIALEKAKEMLEAVGLRKRLSHKPNQLSGGERQRVNIARALIHKPQLLIADEPTGSLDEKTGDLVMRLIYELLERSSATLLMATHNPDLITKGQQVLSLHNGTLTAKN